MNYHELIRFIYQSKHINEHNYLNKHNYLNILRDKSKNMPNDNTLYEKLERYGNFMVDAETYLLEGEMNRGLGAISKIVPEELASKLEPYFIA
ncbi:MAG: hypothetical protein QW139_01745, partial [Candidatus Micrarchaeaceae archaeon]